MGRCLPSPHPVLARVSPSYPRLTGRLSTCYSTVCRWKLSSPARLAYLRHAASVRPEPGSNSPQEVWNRSNGWLEPGVSLTLLAAVRKGVTDATTRLVPSSNLPNLSPLFSCQGPRTAARLFRRRRRFPSEEEPEHKKPPTASGHLVELLPGSCRYCSTRFPSSAEARTLCSFQTLDDYTEPLSQCQLLFRR